MSNPIDPLATSPAVVPTDPTNKYDAPPGPSCFACGGYHGSVNQGMLCLQLTLRATRRRVGDLEATLRDVDHEIATGLHASRYPAGHDMTAREAIAKALGTVDAGRPVLIDTVSTWECPDAWHKMPGVPGVISYCPTCTLELEQRRVSK